MESEWRWNVWEWGLQYEPIGASGIWPVLVSQHATFPGFFVAKMIIGGAAFAGGYFGDTGTGEFVYIGTIATVPGHPNFPYGYPVEPDRP